jgi:hypothetical protein
MDDLFQKWAVWHHIERAAAQLSPAAQLPSAAQLSPAAPMASDPRQTAPTRQASSRKVSIP